MDLILTDEQAQLRDSAEKFFRASGGPRHARAFRNIGGGFDRDRLREMAALGWFGLLAPADRDGLDLGACELALLLEQAGRALAPEPLALAILSAMALADADDPLVRRDLLAPALRGDLLIVPALHEGPDGADIAARATTLRRDGADLLLSGHKDVVPVAAGADGFLVNAEGPDGLYLVHVGRDADGLSIDGTTTVDGRPHGRLTFANVRIRHVIARPNAAPASIRRLYDLMLVALSAELLGVMSAAHDITVAYLKTRQQFGRPIGSFQALQHRAVDDYILIESTRSLLYQSCNAVLSPAMAAALKSFASGAALSVTKSAIQLHGAIGFTDEYDAGLYLKRAMWLAAAYGNEAAQRERYTALD